MKKIILIFSFFVSMVFVYGQNAATPLRVNDKAPSFEGKDQNGKTVSLKNLIKKGDVVLLFYRGQWCPYCNKQLKAMEDSLSFITDKGATVIAVTPETTDNVDKTIKKTDATYSVISDEGLQIMKAYKVAFDVDQATIDKYINYGIDFDKANGANGAVLPVPAVYIINKQGNIVYAYFDTDYKNRASIKEIVSHL